MPRGNKIPPAKLIELSPVASFTEDSSRVSEPDLKAVEQRRRSPSLDSSDAIIQMSSIQSGIEFPEEIEETLASSPSALGPHGTASLLNFAPADAIRLPHSIMKDHAGQSSWGRMPMAWKAVAVITVLATMVFLLAAICIPGGQAALPMIGAVTAKIVTLSLTGSIAAVGGASFFMRAVHISTRKRKEELYQKSLEDRCTDPVYDGT